jgi:hypothetical protein
MPGREDPQLPQARLSFETALPANIAEVNLNFNLNSPIYMTFGNATWFLGTFLWLLLGRIYPTMFG